MSESRRLYFDNNATTAVDERVVEAMLPFLREAYGNPNSLHGFGEEAADALAAARSAVARLIGARSPSEIVFTSGGTEGNNAAIRAALAAGKKRGAELVLTSAVEHSAVQKPLDLAAEDGWRVDAIGVDGDGRLDLDRLLFRIDEAGERCALVSVMWANNETGVVVPRADLKTIADACRAQGIPFVVDAVQVPGKLPLDVAELGIDALSISAHKFHGPKGAGALYLRSGFDFSPLIAGGPQERERRAGTPNVPGIAGLGRAADLAREHAGDPAAGARLAGLRDALENGLLESIPGAVAHATAAPRLPNTASVRFPDVDGEILLATLAQEGLAVSTGAACSSERQAPSHVLLAMGLSEAEAAATLRLSLSRLSTPDEVAQALEIVPAAVASLQGLAS